VLVLALTLAAVIGGVWCLQQVPLDAIPDLSDTQVIVALALGLAARTSSRTRSPIPIVSALLGAPR
jgi:Cu(I)/Ag(I) efflux system membrane protein CusA/SilA